MAERHQLRSSSSKLREDKRLPSSESAAKNGLSSRTSRGTTGMEGGGGGGGGREREREREGEGERVIESKIKLILFGKPNINIE